MCDAAAAVVNPGAAAGPTSLRAGDDCSCKLSTVEPSRLRQAWYIALMSKFDLSTHVERSRRGPCFVCAHLDGHPDYVHEPVYGDEVVVAFLSRYPTLLGYTIVAPRPHVVDVTGDYRLFRQVTELVHDVGEALKKTLPTERIYLMSLGSHQGNAHVHWHVAPLPPGVPYERQQFHAVMAENGILEVTREEQAALAARLRSAVLDQRRTRNAR